MYSWHTLLFESLLYSKGNQLRICILDMSIMRICVNTPFHCGLCQKTGYSSLYYTVRPCLSILDAFNKLEGGVESSKFGAGTMCPRGRSFHSSHCKWLGGFKKIYKNTSNDIWNRLWICMYRSDSISKNNGWCVCPHLSEMLKIFPFGPLSILSENVPWCLCVGVPCMHTDRHTHLLHFDWIPNSLEFHFLTRSDYCLGWVALHFLWSYSIALWCLLHMLISLGWETPRQLVKHHFWMCLWRYFWKKNAIWIIDNKDTQCGWASSNPMRAWIEQKCGGKEKLPSLSWDSHLFLPLNICAPGFGAFGLKLRLKLLESPPLIGSYSEMEVHHQHTWASSL